jgi:hypothetical protein
MPWFRRENTYPLMRSQKNDVFLILQAQKLEPLIANFHWGETRFKNKCSYDGLYSALSYQDVSHQYWFHFYGRANDFWPYYFPNEKLGHTYVEWYKREHRRNWDEILRDVAVWAQAVAAQVLVPDYWDTPAALASKLFGNLGRDHSDRRFSREEIGKVRLVANEYRRQLAAKYSITPEQASEIDRHLAYLVHEAESQTRQAWFHTAIGVIVTIAAIIRPEAGVLAGVVALFGSLFGAFGNRKQLGP